MILVINRTWPCSNCFSQGRRASPKENPINSRQLVVTSIPVHSTLDTSWSIPGRSRWSRWKTFASPGSIKFTVISNRDAVRRPRLRLWLWWTRVSSNSRVDELDTSKQSTDWLGIIVIQLLLLKLISQSILIINISSWKFLFWRIRKQEWSSSCFQYSNVINHVNQYQSSTSAMITLVTVRKNFTKGYLRENWEK